MKIEIDVDEAYSDTAIVIHTPRLTPDTEKLISLIRMLNMQIAVKRDGETHLLDTEKILYIEAVERSTFGIILLLFVLFGLTIGDSAKEYSSLFTLGSQDFSTATILQLFLLSVIISLAQITFLTDRWIQNLALILRNILFFTTVILTIVIFVILFDWFPIDDLSAWAGFALSFAACTAASVAISRLKEKTENKKMEQALGRMQK